MYLDLINPFEEVVVFGKRFSVVDTTQNVRVIRALVPTGPHIGHGNDLKVVHGPRSGGRKAGLERYTGGHGGGRHGILRATKR